jgi:hypothetical protein
MTLDASLLDEALRTLGAVLEQRGRYFEIVTVGGSSLLLIGLSHRATRDEELLAAARWARTHDPSEAFGQELRAALRSFGIEDVGDEP